MSVIIGKGILIDCVETVLECPICTGKFDATGKMDKAKYPTFKTKCPNCKGWIGISIPIFGGTTECFEWNVPKNVNRLKTKAEFKVEVLTTPNQ